MTETPRSLPPLTRLAADIRGWGRALGFDAVGMTRARLEQDEAWLKRWIALGRHGDMDWLARHGVRRSRPAELVPGTISVICTRMDYLPPDAREPWQLLAEQDRAYVSRYALGRDYHKVLRNRLQRLADRI